MSMVVHSRAMLMATGAAFLLASGVAVPALASDIDACSVTAFSYAGTVTNPQGETFTIPAYTSTPGSTSYTGRDASVCNYLDNGPNSVQFGTNWFSSLDGQDDGIGNPNDTDTGFVQIFDPDGKGVLTTSGGWTDSTHTTFTMTITGASAVGDPNAGPDRLWAAPEIGGASTQTYGTFNSYLFQMTATFAPGAVTMTSPGYWSTTAMPLTVTGGFSGTFTNTGNTDPAALGDYAFNLTFDSNQNWARANDIYPDGDPFNFWGAGAAAIAVPEPSALGMFGLGLLGLGLGLCVRRRGTHRIG